MCRVLGATGHFVWSECALFAASARMWLVFSKKMIAETDLFIRSYPKVSPRIELARMPVRDLDQYPSDGSSAPGT